MYLRWPRYVHVLGTHSYERMALQYSPTTGMYVDTATGQVYHDAAGSVPSTDPGLTSQAQRSLGISNQLLSGLSQYGAQYAQAQTGQNQLGSYLNRIITGSAPSVAGQQLTQGLGEIKSGIESTASGATGNNQPLAQYGSLQGYADAAAKANQAAAQQRTVEQNAAVAAKGQLLGQQANESANMFGTSLSGAGQFSGQAGQTGTAQADIDQKNRQMWMNFVGNLAGAGGAIGVKAATG